MERVRVIVGHVRPAAQKSDLMHVPCKSAPPTMDLQDSPLNFLDLIDPSAKNEIPFESAMKSLPRPEVDPSGLLEYSVVYTDRSVNHMSKKFQQVMCDISSTLKDVFGAQAVAIVPGSGTYAMEAVARQFGTGQKCLVIRNGYFSYRWSQIFEACSIPSEEIVLKARPVEDGPNPAYAPCPISEVVETIRCERPAVVFAPHVETASGMLLPNSYIKAVADAVHEVGGLFVLDCVASGCLFVDMAALGIDVVISAPQKGFSGPPCAGLVMMSQRAREAADSRTSTSFCVDLKKWIGIMEAYEGGGHMYHATMPTDALVQFRNVLEESKRYGFDRLMEAQKQLGSVLRRQLARRGIKSVAAEGFHAPGVIVSYTDDSDIPAKFAASGMQVAARVPLMVDDFTESPAYKSFRLGLFGLDKLQNIPRSVHLVEQVIDNVMGPKPLPQSNSGTVIRGETQLLVQMQL